MPMEAPPGEEQGRLASPAAGARGSLFGRVRATLIVVAGLPVLGLALLGSVLFLPAEFAEAERELRAIAGTLAVEVDTHVALHAEVVAAAAEAAARADFDTGEVQAIVTGLRTFHDGVLTAIAADAQGRLIAASPERGADGVPLVGQGILVSDRDYFRGAIAGRGVYVSPAFRGRGLGDDPIVALAAGVVVGGAVRGIVEASLDLSRFRVLADRFGDSPGRRVVIVDATEAVVFDSSRQDALLDVVTARPGDLRGRAEAPRRGWSVIVEQDRSQVFVRAIRFLVIGAVIAAAGALGAYFLGQRLARRITIPLGRLVDAADRLQLGDRLDVRPDPDAPEELLRLQESLTSMSARLERSLSGIVPICAGCKKVHLEEGAWVGIERYVSERSEADFSHGLCPVCEARYGGD